MTNNQSKKVIPIAIIALFAILLLVDRYYWAQISQWREDQATNIWLGYTAQFGHMPVGLISSVDIPNPNGMVLLGYVLSALPNLLSVSFSLGTIQIILLVLVGWKLFEKNWWYFILTTVPSLFSVVLRSTSVEFWNQYTITLINIFFLFWMIRYLSHSSIWNLLPVIALILLAPSLYLAGIVNALTMILLTLGIVIYKRPRFDKSGFVFIVGLSIVLISALLTWLPYFQNVPLDQLTDLNKARPGPIALLQSAWESLFGFPNYATFQWADKTVLSMAFKHSSPDIISSTANMLLRVAGRAYMIQAIFAFLALAYTIINALLSTRVVNETEGVVNTSVARIVILSGLFIGLSYTFSTWLGGPAWIDNERPDQIVQFIPMFLFVIFLLPHIILANQKIKKIITGISAVSLFLFVTVNLFCGILIIQSHIQYRGNVLTEADIPLIDKTHAVDFIADDWTKYSNSNTIPVDYNLDGGRWDWVPEFGIKLLPWYPAPMTQGRSFDYELLRRYGLTNQQEGIQLRSFGTGRYLITYAFEPAPQVTKSTITHYIFGRLRVSIVE